MIYENFTKDRTPTPYRTNLLLKNAVYAPVLWSETLQLLPEVANAELVFWLLSDDKHNAQPTCHFPTAIRGGLHKC